MFNIFINTSLLLLIVSIVTANEVYLLLLEGMNI